MYEGYGKKKERISGNDTNLTEEAVETAEESLFYKSIAEALQLIDLEKDLQKRSELSKAYKSR